VFRSLMSSRNRRLSRYHPVVPLPFLCKACIHTSNS
jgi:hypothetical protein